MKSIEPLEARTFLSAAPVDPNTDYLSALRPTASTNGWGPIELDRSNGENPKGDGTPLMIGGRFYRRGLGVHSDSEVHYKLADQYRSFTADVGIDDEVGDAGSVVFRVFADGLKMFDSGVMTGASRTRRINIDVSGMNELVLSVTNAGDGSDLDHADFGNARLIKPVGLAPVIAQMPNMAIDQINGVLSVGGSFRDDSVGPWVGTVDWGDGRSREYINLEDTNTFLLSHTYPPSADATYTVTLRINDGAAVGVSTFDVSYSNVAPSMIGLIGETNADGSFGALAGLPLNVGGGFSDPGAFGGETYSASVDYGDGTPIVTAPADGRFFEAGHTYREAGVYTVTSTVTDSGGKSGVGTNTVIVNAPALTYVSDMRTAKTGGDFNYDRSAAGSRLWINGRKYTRGVGVAADSELVYNIGGKYRFLTGDVGLDDESDAAISAVQFLVYGDGNLLFDSGMMTSDRGAKRMTLDVRGVQELKLVVANAGTAESAHGDWGNIRFAA